MAEESGAIFSLYTNKYLKPALMNNGYASVELFNDKGSKRVLVHRIIAAAFIPNPNNYPCVNHKDEVRDHNWASNLEWCDYKYNINYGTCSERRIMHTDYTTQIRKDIARENGRKKSKAVRQLRKDGQLVAVFPSSAEAGRLLKTSNAHIIDVCKGKRKTAAGYRWEYVKEE